MIIFQTVIKSQKFRLNFIFKLEHTYPKLNKANQQQQQKTSHINKYRTDFIT